MEQGRIVLREARRTLLLRADYSPDRMRRRGVVGGMVFVVYTSAAVKVDDVRDSRVTGGRALLQEVVAASPRNAVQTRVVV